MPVIFVSYPSFGIESASVQVVGDRSYIARLTIQSPPLGSPGSFAWSLRAVLDARDSTASLLSNTVSISHAHEICAQLFDRVRGCAGLYCLWVVCDEERLFRLDNDYAFSTLVAVSIFTSFVAGFPWGCTFLPYKLVSSALITMYFWPAMCNPVDWTFFGIELSLYAPTISCIS